MTDGMHIVDRLNALAPKERVIYWTGFVARDRGGSSRADDIANIAYQHYLAGRVDLVQRRLGDNVYDYIAIGLTRPFESRPAFTHKIPLKPANPGQNPCKVSPGTAR